jgi:hypothetical protein
MAVYHVIHDGHLDRKAPPVVDRNRFEPLEYDHFLVAQFYSCPGAPARLF